MHVLIDNGFPKSKAPISNTALAGDHIYSVEIPRAAHTQLPSGEGEIKELLGESHLIEIVALGHIGHHK
jgi:hypothetical protein